MNAVFSGNMCYSKECLHTSHVIGLVNRLQFLERINFDNVFVAALAHFDRIVFLPVNQRHLFPITLFSAGRLITLPFTNDD